MRGNEDIQLMPFGKFFDAVDRAFGRKYRANFGSARGRDARAMPSISSFLTSRRVFNLTGQKGHLGIVIWVRVDRQACPRRLRTLVRVQRREEFFQDLRTVGVPPREPLSFRSSGLCILIPVVPTVFCRRSTTFIHSLAASVQASLASWVVFAPSRRSLSSISSSTAVMVSSFQTQMLLD
ncbi:MAG: hypothetical protein ACI8Z1_000315 [Candidatus Azotimanducaceae bacterium]|jgi:hypothetical protein